MGRPKPIEIGDGERYVPLTEAVDMLGAPSVAALRNRIYRSPSPENDGFAKRGGRWFVLFKTPKEEEKP